MLYGVFQESLYKKQEDGTIFAETAFVLFVQCVFNAIVSFVADGVVGAMASPGTGKNAEAPGSVSRWLPMLATREVAVTSIVYILAMYTSNEALQYVTYPTQALAKSCKMIPVLVGRVLISGQRYSWVKYACVLMMTVGIALFQLWGKKRATVEGFGGETTGMILLGVSLILDGMAGPFQEGLKRAHKMTSNQQIILNNVWASGLMLLVAIALGQFGKSVRQAPPTLSSAAIMATSIASNQLKAHHALPFSDPLPLSARILSYAPPGGCGAGSFLIVLCVRPDLHLPDNPHIRFADALDGDNDAQILHDCCERCSARQRAQPEAVVRCPHRVCGAFAGGCGQLSGGPQEALAQGGASGRCNGRNSRRR